MVITTCWRRICLVASATRRGSSRSVIGGRPVSMAQKPQFRVQTLPRIMNVAVPSAQHSPDVRAARLLADGVQPLGADDALRAGVGAPGADADLEPLRPPAARAGILRDRVARGEESAVHLGAAGIHHLGGRGMAADRVADDRQLTERGEVRAGSGAHDRQV